MYKISLVNMPFSDLSIPSIALTQLRWAVRRRFGDSVRVRILYLNLDFAAFLGEQLYRRLQDSNTTGLGEWVFRRIAFPEQPENSHQYFKRYPLPGAIKGRLLAKRNGVERFLMSLLHRHRLAEEDLVGFTSMFSQNLPSFAMARMIKSANANALIVMGGANCEAQMGRELARRIESVDFVFSGPGLVSFPQFLERQLSGEADECHRIQGVFSRRNADRAPSAIGRELPVEKRIELDYDSFLADLRRRFRESVEPRLPFETSRGCWWGERAHCTFCGLNGASMAYRSMPEKTALEQIQDLIARYSDRCSLFESVDNIMPKSYVDEVFGRLQPPGGVSIFYEVKADLSAQDLETLAQGGVTKIQPGIESLATSTLKLMKKGTTALRNLVFLKNCLRFGIEPSWNLLIGFPGESREVYEKYLGDIPLLHHLYPPSGVYPVRFDRFSPYHAHAAAYGLELAPYDFYKMLYPDFSQTELSRLAYYFEDRNYSADYLAQMVPYQSSLERAVEEWKRRSSRQDGRLPACLEIAGAEDSRIVSDTRSGELVEHRLDDLQLRILQLVDQRGLKVQDIARRLDVEAEEAQRSLDELSRRRLLFGENQRWLSLVVRQPDSAGGTRPGQGASAHRGARDRMIPAKV